MKTKLKLVDDWRQCWRWVSVHCMAINTAILGTWAMLPEEFKQSFDARTIAFAAVIVSVLGIAGRLIDQYPKNKTTDEHEGVDDGHFQ
jgi:hypothetical protein